MVYTVSVVVFAPNFPAGTPAEERIQELARSIQRCKDEEPFRKALDNEIGKQILSVATSKMEQLKKTMKTSASLADTWKKLKVLLSPTGSYTFQFAPIGSYWLLMAPLGS